MILYNDILTGKEMFSDSYKIELLPCIKLDKDGNEVVVDDVYYKITGKYVVEDNNVDESVYGGNKSAEAEGEDVDETPPQTVINFVHASKLQEVKFPSLNGTYPR